MASRSHRSMPPGHSYWGSFAGTANLPNVSGAPIQSAKVQVGDVAFDSVDGKLYVCTAAGVGTATWASAHSPGSGRVLWTPSGNSSFALLDRDAGTDLSLSYGTMPLEPYAQGITLTTGAGSTPGVTLFRAVGLTIPSSNRFRVHCKIGARATATSGVSPMVFLFAQSAQRYVAVSRLASNTARWGGDLRNNVTTASTYDSVAGIGSNDNQNGYMTIDVTMRQPSSGVDPAFEICVDSGQGFSQRVGDLTTTWTGGSPPHSSGWNVAWQSGGPLYVCFGGYEYAGAGSSVISNMAVLKHPLDW